MHLMARKAQNRLGIEKIACKIAGSLPAASNRTSVASQIARSNTACKRPKIHFPGSRQFGPLGSHAGARIALCAPFCAAARMVSALRWACACEISTQQGERRPGHHAYLQHVLTRITVTSRLVAGELSKSKRLSAAAPGQMDRRPAPASAASSRTSGSAMHRRSETA